MQATPINAMATLYFPQNVPMDARASKLVAKCCEIHSKGGSPSTVSVNDQTVTTIPPHYFDYTKHFLYREDCLRLILYLHKQLKIPGKLYRNLLMILCYMGEVFKCFVMELPEEVDGDTASKTFESYWKI